MPRAAVQRALVIATAVTLAACGASPITAARIEASIAPTFANLVRAQLVRLGLPPLAAADLTVRASCRRLVTDTGPTGSGDWVCALAWSGPNRTTLEDTYDLAVGTDACYTATVDGANTGLGGPMVPVASGGNVRNLLYAFDACFDPAR